MLKNLTQKVKTYLNHPTKENQKHEPEIQVKEESLSKEEAEKIFFSVKQKEKLKKSYQGYQEKGGMPFGKVIGET